MDQDSFDINLEENRYEQDETAGDSMYEIDFLHLRLPLKLYQISYQVADEGQFSLTSEFLLRILKALSSVSEREIAQFFQFSADEVSYIVNSAERFGFIQRNNGLLQLTALGDSKFENNSDEPCLYSVHKKARTLFFDLISFCPQASDHLDKFTCTLPELPLLDHEAASNSLSIVKDSFRHNYQEIKIMQNSNETEKSSIYSIDDIAVFNRSSSLIPVSIKLKDDSIRGVEPDLSNWVSSTGPENRYPILESCSLLLKKYLNIDRESFSSAADYLQECAPAWINPFFVDAKFDAYKFLKHLLAKQQPPLDKEKTSLIYGSLLTRRNFNSILGFFKKNTKRNNKHLVWIRPNTPFWGCFSGLKDLVEFIVKRPNDLNKNYSLSSILYAHNPIIQETTWRFKEVFTKILPLQKNNLPNNFELFLVPGCIFAALIHIPVMPQGYPIPLGIMSHDQELISGVHDIVTDLLRPDASLLERNENYVSVYQHLYEYLNNSREAME